MRTGPGCFIAALAWFVLGMGAFFSDTLFLVWTVSGLCLLPVVALDAAVLALVCCRYGVTRELPRTLAQGEPVKVLLRIYRERGALRPGGLRIFDLYPSLMDTAAFPARISRDSLRSGEAEFTYTLIPRERGPWLFPGLEFLYTSPLGFWRRKVFAPCRARGRTFPDFKKFGPPGALRGLLEEPGLREIRRRGQGLEFRDLREYQEGDPMRSIDWRATGRQQSPHGFWRFMVREYQEEQDQQVLCILDTGYRFREAEFDAALRGTMLLSYAALKHGDAAAVMSFGGTERWVPPRKGLRNFKVIMNGIYDLQRSSAPSSPFFALESALARLHRRTFIILISNFREEDGPSLSWILPRVRRKHLLLLVSFREAEAERLARRTAAELFDRPSPFRKKSGLPASKHAGLLLSGKAGLPLSEKAGLLLSEKAGLPLSEKALESAAAFSYLAARGRLYRGWEHQGLLTMEASAENFSSALLNRYLDVKRSGKL